MSLQSVQKDWQMDSRSHSFSDKTVMNPAVAKILSFLKEYDEICEKARAQLFDEIKDYEATSIEARAQMIKNINEFLEEK
jgi:hypothetical protein